MRHMGLNSRRRDTGDTTGTTRPMGERSGQKLTRDVGRKPEGGWKPLERTGTVVGADKPGNQEQKGF